jgi:hypothetical protein
MFMSRHNLILGVAALALLATAAMPASAASLFWDQMSSASAANWGVNATADTLATFGFDYSTAGIPEAPHSMGGDVPTVGVKLEANIVDPGESNQISLYPTGQSFNGYYKLSFDAWMNYDVQEVIQGDSAGTTEFIGGGVGYNGTATDLGSGVQAVGTGDGGSAFDYRVFKSNNTDPAFFVPDAQMAGGSRNANQPWWESFLPGQTPPAGQAPPQAALAGPDGTLGFQWVTWNIGVQGDDVYISLEKPNGDVNLMAHLNCGASTGTGDSGCTTDGNIMLFYADFFSSVSPRAVWTYGIIDNVHVTEIPEPSSLVLLGLASLACFGRRSR